MFLNAIILATSVSIDSLGIGITYGIRKTKISSVAKVILFCISLVVTSLSILIGNVISQIFPVAITKFIGVFLLVGMGIWIIYQAATTKEEVLPKQNKALPKTYHIFLKSLGITIQIIRNPISSDLDQSKMIDAKEACYLGLALSIDSICVGIGSSIMGISSFLFPILVATFQLIFLSFGIGIGKRVISSFPIPDNVWSIVSGLLLIGIGISRLFF